MLRIIRNIIAYDEAPNLDALRYNMRKLDSTSLDWDMPVDTRIYGFVQAHFTKYFEAPNLQLVIDYFEARNDPEAIERLNDAKSIPTYYYSNFLAVLSEIKEAQNSIKAVSVFKEAQEIALKGLTLKDGRDKIKLQGVSDAFKYIANKSIEVIRESSNARLRGTFRADAEEVWQDYLAAKNDKSRSYGKATGFEEIDRICHGIKRGELWVHAAYAGELKCLPGDVTIYDHATKRRRTLEELYASKDLPTVTALYREGLEPRLVQANASHLVQNGIRDVYEVILESGKCLPGTSNHKLYTLDGWQEISALQEGTWVAVPKRIDVVDPCVDYTDAEIRFIGYLIGDGHLKREINLTASNFDIREDFKACLVEMGLQEGSADYIQPTFKETFFESRAPNVRVSRSQGLGNSPMVSPAWALLDKLGLYGKGAYLKNIPAKMFGLSEEQTALLLGALWSTDGSGYVGVHSRKDRRSLCSRTDIKYASVSKRLCLDIQSLLLRIGVLSTVCEVKTTYKGKPYTFFSVTVVTNESKRVFVSKVRVVGKEGVFAKLSKMIPQKDTRVVPSSFLPPGRKYKTSKGYLRHSNSVRIRPTVTTSEVSRFVTPEDKSAWQAIHGDIAWERVTRIEFRGAEMTYDLSVPEHHSFVANDVITHNTSFATNWCYNLITRYRSNVYYASLEMKYEHIRRLIYVIHSANKLFQTEAFKQAYPNLKPGPLDYRKVRDGELSQEEEEFFKIVCTDFAENTNYCDFDTWAPDSDVTIRDLQVDAELVHQQKELGLIVIDHGGLAEAQKGKKNRDYTIELNSVIRDAKKLALHFNKGEGIGVALLFQINREGKDAADKNDGVYKMRALAQSNEAERSADIITTTYLNPDLRKEGQAVFANLKNRDNPLIEPFRIGVDFVSRRLYNLNPFSGNSENLTLTDYQARAQALQEL